mmetsp:Transcript_39141/g.92085  ORF Transcript_39141/g.92085 Transcript_39141/m.92085 type:complete len:91 (-) Transcript_39141:7-279(-)
MHLPDPSPLRRLAVVSQACLSREQIKTLAPFWTSPSAIISPMPRPPPVTSTFLPATVNKFPTSILPGSTCSLQGGDRPWRAYFHPDLWNA